MAAEGRALLQHENGDPIIFAIHQEVDDREVLIGHIQKHRGMLVDQLAQADFYLFSTFVQETVDVLPRVIEAGALPVDSAWITTSILSGKLKPWYQWRYRPLGGKTPSLPKEEELRDAHEIAMYIATIRCQGIREDEDMYKRLARRYPHKSSQEFMELHQHQIQAIQTCVFHYVELIKSFEPPPGCMFLPSPAPRLETQVARQDTPRSSHSGPVPFPIDYASSADFERSPEPAVFENFNADMIRRQIGSPSMVQGRFDVSHSHSAPPTLTAGLSKKKEGYGKALSPTTISAAKAAVSTAVYHRPMNGKISVNSTQPGGTDDDDYPPNYASETRRDKGKGRLPRSSFVSPVGNGLPSPVHSSQSPPASAVQVVHDNPPTAAPVDAMLSIPLVPIKQESIEVSLPPSVEGGTSSTLPCPTAGVNRTVRRSTRRMEAQLGPSDWVWMEENKWVRVTDLTANPDYC